MPALRDLSSTALALTHPVEICHLNKHATPTKRLAALAGLLALVFPLPVLAQNVRLTEIMYHSGGATLMDQWFELYNPSANRVDLSGWRVTQGVEFEFPSNTVIEARGFLVMAAHGPTFRSLHPTVTPVISGWIGYLSRDGEEIRIEDRAGNTIDSVAYAPEGDWAARRLGAPDVYRKQGWEWFAEHDGRGKSLELIQGGLPNHYGQNWGSSLIAGGTPGRPNSVESTDIAPLILDVAHFPVLPKSSDPVAVTARLLDERVNGITATLHWRIDGSNIFGLEPMFDDGRHHDGLANDGRFGCELQPARDGSIVEFYVTARDAGNHERAYPHVMPTGATRSANLVYQVDNSVYEGRQPIFRLIMTPGEYDYLASEIWRAAPNSDAQVNGTFLSAEGALKAGGTIQFRYNAGFRNRGHGSRVASPRNFRVNFPKDRPWKGRAGINLNTQYTHSQQLGSAVFHQLGLPTPNSTPVQVRVNAANLAKPGQEQFGSYAANELVDEEMLRRHFPLDHGGNHYRGIRDAYPGNPKADLAWHGDSLSSYTNAYFKSNNKTLDDWSDLVGLIDALNNSTHEAYTQAVRKVANVEAWMTYFAANTLFANGETSLSTGYGDDFSMYRGVVDPRFLLLPYDMDSVMGRGLTSATPQNGLFRMVSEGTTHFIPSLNRFMKHPDFAPLYFRELKTLAETIFSPTRMNPLLNQLLTSYVDAIAVDAMKQFNSNHVAYVLSQIPLALTVSHGLPLVSGYPRTTLPTMTLHGTGNAIETRSILVNGREAVWTPWKGVWTNTAVALQPGLNHLRVKALGENGKEVGQTTVDIWLDSGTITSAGAVLSSDTVWKAEGGPYKVASSLTVEKGATLTIEPGTSIFLGPNADLIVANGGRLLAEGTPTSPIHFTRAPGSPANWGGIVVYGGIGSPETRLSHAHLAFNGSTAIHSLGGTVFLDHLTFGNTAEQYLSLDSSSFVVRDCVFPNATAEFELVHGTGGIKGGGHGVIQRCLFGLPIGYNDVVDFTGGRRPAPIIHFLNNVFLGASDDALDLDGTDAWIEGNLFLHVHKNESPDSASAISGGNDGGSASALTILGNIFYDCDHVATAKQGNFYVFLNNTVVRQTKAGGADADAAVLNFADEGDAEGAGMHIEGNVIYDVEKLTRFLAAASVTFTNNLLPVAWAGPGGNNSTADPRLKYVPKLSETFFTTWEGAQILRDWFSLLPGSPGRAGGLNDQDLGGVRQLGASLSGEPQTPTAWNHATLRIGLGRAGGGIPRLNWPSGAGMTHYKYRIDSGAWSAEQSIDTLLGLTSLADGPHEVEVAGKRDSGLYQDDPLFGVDAHVTRSSRWVVDPSVEPVKKTRVRLNEVMAKNTLLPGGNGAFPDLIEVFNYGETVVDLSGMGITAEAAHPYKFVFPKNSSILPGGFLVVKAESVANSSELQTGFQLKQSGDSVYLFDKPAGGGLLLDAVSFGPQLPDFSIGRAPDGVWTLCRPTFGAPNYVEACGDGRALRINEWLAESRFAANGDFVELHNPGSLPVALGGWFLSDASGSPKRNLIAPLTFIAGHGFLSFIADGRADKGPEHLNFKLSQESGLILLTNPDAVRVDAVSYYSQRADVSEGRSPNGSETLAFLAQPTAGGPNPDVMAVRCAVDTLEVPLLPLNAAWRYNQSANLDKEAWKSPGYEDGAWPIGQGFFGVEDCGCIPAPGLGTALAIGRSTYYFRTHFVVETNLAAFNLTLKAIIDDGAVLYLNGTRFAAFGVNNDAPAYATLASRDVGNATPESVELPIAGLLPGTNVLAVELHQASANSSDLVMGIALSATRSVTNCAPSSVFPVAINEIFARGTPTAEGFDPASDWVELHNQGATTVDLSDLSLSDEASFGRKFVFPRGTTIPANGFHVVFCQPGAPVSSTNTGFALRATGGALFLFNTSSSNTELIDAIRYGLQTRGYSIGRFPDGSGAWDLGLVTPDSANKPAPMGTISLLRINEWMTDPTSGKDWFEVFNSGPLPVALGGLFLTDDLANKVQSPVRPLSFIGVGPDAFIKIIADGILEAGADHVLFSLSKSGEQLGIFSPSGELIDGLGFGIQSTGVSQGRFPDGSPNLFSFPTTPTPAQNNRLAGPASGDADDDGLADSWELANFGSTDRDGRRDFDNDTASDKEEYIAGTNPRDSLDSLKINGAIVLDGQCILRFTAVEGRSYTIQFSDDPISGIWQPVSHIAAPAATGPAQIIDSQSLSGIARFYRLVTPAVR